MGIFTEFHYNTSLRKTTPTDVIDTLQLMLTGNIKTAPVFHHPLFKTGRWSIMLQCDSYYFDAKTHSTLHYDEIATVWFLCIRCNLKNYDNEIEKFCDWIRPYIDKTEGDFLGFSRYAETETPTLIYA